MRLFTVGFILKRPVHEEIANSSALRLSKFLWQQKVYCNCFKMAY